MSSVEQIAIDDFEVVSRASHRKTETEQFLPQEPVFQDASGVWLGAPHRKHATGWEYTVPFEPHVYEANLTISRGNHEVTEPRLAQVIIAHGKTSKAGNWALADGRNIADVIRCFNQHNLRQSIEVAAICNQGGSPDRPELPHVIHALGSKVLVRLKREGNWDYLNMSLEDEANGVFYVPSTLQRLARARA
jgi:hypothetical protein